MAAAGRTCGNRRQRTLSIRLVRRLVPFRIEMELDVPRRGWRAGFHPGHRGCGGRAASRWNSTIPGGGLEGRVPSRPSGLRWGRSVEMELDVPRGGWRAGFHPGHRVAAGSQGRDGVRYSAFRGGVPRAYSEQRISHSSSPRVTDRSCSWSASLAVAGRRAVRVTV